MRGNERSNFLAYPLARRPNPHGRIHLLLARASGHTSSTPGPETVPTEKNSLLTRPAQVFFYSCRPRAPVFFWNVSHFYLRPMHSSTKPAMHVICGVWQPHTHIVLNFSSMPGSKAGSAGGRGGGGEEGWVVVVAAVVVVVPGVHVRATLLGDDYSTGRARRRGHRRVIVVGGCREQTASMSTAATLPPGWVPSFPSSWCVTPGKKKHVAKCQDFVPSDPRIIILFFFSR